MSLKELREKRAKLVEQMRAVAELSEKEGRSLNAEEEAKFNEIDADQESVGREIERRQKVEAAERDLERPITPGTPPSLDTRGHAAQSGGHPTSEERNAKEMRAFDSWIRFGFEGMDQEQRAIMARRRTFISAAELPAEIRAQGVGTGAGGGYTVPQGFSEELDTALKAFGGMRQAARLFPTPDGRDLPWPTVDDTANVGELLAENVAVAAQDVPFGQKTLKAYKYSSKVVLVSMELLQDSFFDVGAILRDLLAERIGRITNTHFTTGDNTGKPEGVVPGAGSGKVGLTGQTVSVIYDDLVDLEHSVDPLYRPQSIFMMNDSSLKILKKLKDTSGRPLWMPGLNASFAVSQPETILGYPYSINQDMAVMAANAKSILFGNFMKYIIRDVREFTLIRLVERYAELGQVGFIAFTRSDGRYLNAAAVKYYQNSAT